MKAIVIETKCIAYKYFQVRTCIVQGGVALRADGVDVGTGLEQVLVYLSRLNPRS